MHLDKLEQYGRRENLKIHGVPTVRNESTNQIVKTMAKALNVQLDERHISTSPGYRNLKTKKKKLSVPADYSTFFESRQTQQNIQKTKIFSSQSI